MFQASQSFGGGRGGAAEGGSAREGRVHLERDGKVSRKGAQSGINRKPAIQDRRQAGQSEPQWKGQVRRDPSEPGGGGGGGSPGRADGRVRGRDASRGSLSAQPWKVQLQVKDRAYRFRLTSPTLPSSA